MGREFPYNDNDFSANLGKEGIEVGRGWEEGCGMGRAESR